MQESGCLLELVLVVVLVIDDPPFFRSPTPVLDAVIIILLSIDRPLSLQPVERSMDAMQVGATGVLEFPRRYPAAGSKKNTPARRTGRASVGCSAITSG